MIREDKVENESMLEKFYRVWPLLCLSILAVGCASTNTQSTETATDLTWPRTFENEQNKVIVYQPQIDSWKEHTLLSGKAAVVVEQPGEKAVYAGLFLQTDTEVDTASRTALLKNLKIDRIVVAGVETKQQSATQKIIRDALPKNRSMLVSLDRILANIERTGQRQKGVEVNLDPPPIFYSPEPAILVGFFGSPVLEQIEDVPELSYVTNTNWDIFYHDATSTYFLLYEESWLQSRNIYSESWEAAASLPAVFNQLPATKQWESVRKNVPGKQIEEIPRVISSNQPSELIITDGDPIFADVVGNKLFYVSNTDADLFFVQDEKAYYFLSAGRWFRAGTLMGPWSAASQDLPEVFKEIPLDHETADVLYSVPGTPEAEIAVLLTSVPRRATVKRNEASVNVIYSGQPEFKTVEGAETISYATNTAHSVLLVDDSYYCVYNGVWFVAANPSGPWLVADSVPGVIYTIPANHPLHNVTYVYVYSATPETVVVGYTSGYSGAYVATTGIVMFGLGYWWGRDYHYRHHHYYYPSHYYSYGGSVRYSYNYGSYYRSARYYGPHGGVAGRSGYNPRTGTYYRGGVAAGPNGAAYARQAYNPRTGRSAERAGARTPYESWGRTTVREGSNWARAGHERQGARTVAGVETSRGGAAVGGYNRNTNQGAAVARSRHGDVYAGRNGQVYRRSGNSWNSVNRSSRNVSSANRSYLHTQSRQRSYGSHRASSFQRSGGRVGARGGGRRR